MSRHLRKLLKFFLPFVLGFVILYFLYRKTDFRALWLNIKDANWFVLIFSLIFGLGGNVLRGLRWELLIRPLGFQSKRFNLIYAVLGSCAVNFLLPRAGEIWRCGVISKRSQIPVSKLIGTLIIDRFFDMIMVGLFLLAAFALNVKLFYKNSSLLNLLAYLASPDLYIGLFISLAICVTVLILLKNNQNVQIMCNFLLAIWKDMRLIWRMKNKMYFFLYTFGIWINYFFYFYTAFYAFSFTTHLGVAAGLFIFTLNSISMSIPSNGGLGPWQAATVFGLCAFMVNKEQAVAFATTVFTFQSIWLILCGFFGINMLSFQKKK